jgi:hypothetical protein
LYTQFRHKETLFQSRIACTSGSSLLHQPWRLH